MTLPVYLDYNATTPLDRHVFEEMVPWMTDRFWNAASAHPLGRLASEAVERGREQVADLVGCRPGEVVFTSGATESDNHAVKGVASADLRGRRRVLVGATEHKAVLDAAESLRVQGFEVQHIPVGGDGQIDLDAYRELLDSDVALVSVMLANNETGVIAPVERLAEWAHEVGAIFHSDITQAAGRIPIDLASWGIDLASLSAHKLYGPKGVGALIVSKSVPLEPVIHGGGHERGHRSGTLNVPGIVGFGAAAVIAGKQMEEDHVRQAALIERIVDGLRGRLSGVEWRCESVVRLPNTANLRFVEADAEAVMANAPGVAVSSGSACTSMNPSPSHVLTAMGMTKQAALESIRISVGRPTSVDEIDSAVEQLASAVERVRGMV